MGHAIIDGLEGTRSIWFKINKKDIWIQLNYCVQKYILCIIHTAAEVVDNLWLKATLWQHLQRLTYLNYNGYSLLNIILWWPIKWSKYVKLSFISKPCWYMKTGKSLTFEINAQRSPMYYLPRCKNDPVVSCLTFVCQFQNNLQY